MSQRIGLMVESGSFVVSNESRVVVFHPREQDDLSELPKENLLIVQPNKPLHDFWESCGISCTPVLNEPEQFDAAVVCLPRAKPLARQLVAEAARSTVGPILIDGAKTDGIDSMLKQLKSLTIPTGAISKAHGKAFCIEGGVDLSAWLPDTERRVDSYLTAPGVFSADGVDPASRLLAEALPQKIGKRVADLGAGWGYLSNAILERAGVEELHLVEADHTALNCARINVSDDRATFQWGDARVWGAAASVDAVVMNPPFHTGRSAEPGLGQAFITNAARILTASGQLWLVANRHLPYEDTLNSVFAQVAEISGDNRFKILQAAKPRKRR